MERRGIRAKYVGEPFSKRELMIMKIIEDGLDAMYPEKQIKIQTADYDTTITIGGI